MDIDVVKEVLLASHLFGVAIGAGAAYVSDTLFFASIEDKKIVKDEIRFLKVVSKLVWLGLGLLLITGIGLVLTDPVTYLHSSKFLAKMTIIVILTINGVIFHFHHIPFLDGIINKHLSVVARERYRRTKLMISGVVSFSSWTAALILGSFRQIPLSYIHIMALYGLIIGVGVIVALVIKNILLPSKRISW